jgi:hypothetical protein
VEVVAHVTLVRRSRRKAVRVSIGGVVAGSKEFWHSEVERALAKLAPNGIGADVVPVKADQR